MTARPHVLLSVAASLDGYVDDTSETRLLLSNDADFDRVDEVRAGVDAILIGANTIRTDNPRLLVRSAERQRERIARGRPGNPIKVTMTGSGDLDPSADFFTTGEQDKLVYASGAAVRTATGRIGAAATVIDAGQPLELDRVLADLHGRGVERLMVEGGGTVHTLFLSADVVDELNLVYAPFFVGQADAPRFVRPATFPQNAGRPMHLVEVRQLGDVVLLRYQPFES